MLKARLERLERRVVQMPPAEERNSAWDVLRQGYTEEELRKTFGPLYEVLSDMDVGPGATPQGVLRSLDDLLARALSVEGRV